MTMTPLLGHLGKESDAEVDQRTKALKPGQCAVLVYTSGTTGDPKDWAKKTPVLYPVVIFCDMFCDIWTSFFCFKTWN